MSSSAEWLAKTLVPTFPIMHLNCISTNNMSSKPVPTKVEEIKKMKIGDPLDRSTDHGPQNHKAHLDKLLEYCEVGVKEGATLVYGGKQVDRPGRTHTGRNISYTFHSIISYVLILWINVTSNCRLCRWNATSLLAVSGDWKNYKYW